MMKYSAILWMLLAVPQCLKAQVAKGVTKVEKAEMRAVQPFPYPYIMSLSSFLDFGKITRIMMSFSSYEMMGMVMPMGKAEHYGEVYGRSGEKYTGKVVTGWFTSAPDPDKPGKECCTFSGAFPIYEEPVRVRVYGKSRNGEERVYIDKKCVEDFKVVLRINHNPDIAMFWDCDSSTKESGLIWFEVDYTLDHGKSWEYYQAGSNGAMNIQKILEKNRHPTFRFIAETGFRRFIKYYTLGKGFHDEHPAESNYRPVPLESEEARQAMRASLEKWKQRPSPYAFKNPVILQAIPESGKSLELKPGGSCVLQLVLEKGSREVTAEAKLTQVDGKRYEVFRMNQQTDNSFVYPVLHDKLPSGKWKVAFTVSDRNGMTGKREGGHIIVKQ